MSGKILDSVKGISPQSMETILCARLFRDWVQGDFLIAQQALIENNKTKRFETFDIFVHPSFEDDRTDMAYTRLTDFIDRLINFEEFMGDKNPLFRLETSSGKIFDISLESLSMANFAGDGIINTILGRKDPVSKGRVVLELKDSIRFKFIDAYGNAVSRQQLLMPFDEILQSKKRYHEKQEKNKKAQEALMKKSIGQPVQPDEAALLDTSIRTADLNYSKKNIEKQKKMQEIKKVLSDDSLLNIQETIGDLDELLNTQPNDNFSSPDPIAHNNSNALTIDTNLALNPQIGNNLSTQVPASLPPTTSLSGSENKKMKKMSQMSLSQLANDLQMDTIDESRLNPAQKALWQLQKLKAAQGRAQNPDTLDTEDPNYLKNNAGANTVESKDPEQSFEQTQFSVSAVPQTPVDLLKQSLSQFESNHLQAHALTNHTNHLIPDIATSDLPANHAHINPNLADDFDAITDLNHSTSSDNSHVDTDFDQLMNLSDEPIRDLNASATPLMAHTLDLQSNTQTNSLANSSLNTMNLTDELDPQVQQLGRERLTSRVSQSATVSPAFMNDAFTWNPHNHQPMDKKTIAQPLEHQDLNHSTNIDSKLESKLESKTVLATQPVPAKPQRLPTLPYNLNPVIEPINLGIETNLHWADSQTLGARAARLTMIDSTQQPLAKLVKVQFLMHIEQLEPFFDSLSYFGDFDVSIKRANTQGRFVLDVSFAVFVKSFADFADLLEPFALEGIHLQTLV